MKKTIIIFIFIISLLLTWYKYYTNVTNNKTLINYVKKIEVSTDIYFDLDKVIWTWTQEQDKNLNIIWKNYIKFDKYKVYTSNYFDKYKNIENSIETGLNYDYEYIKVDWERHLTFIAKSLKDWVFLKTIDYSIVNWIDTINELDNEMTFYYNTVIRKWNEKITKNKKLINSFNNWNWKKIENMDLLHLKTFEEKGTVFVIEAKYKNLNKLDNIKINNYKRLIKQNNIEKNNAISNYKDYFHSKEEEKIKKLLLWIKYNYNEFDWYSKELKVIETYYSNKEIEIHNRFLTKYNL